MSSYSCVPAVIVDEAEAPVVRSRWRVALSMFFAALAFAVLVSVAVVLTSGCSAPQNAAALRSFERGARVVGHAAAVVLCASKPLWEPLVLAATPQYPALVIEPVAARLFCEAVASEQGVLASAADHVLPAGVAAPVAPQWVVASDSFAMVPR